METAGMQPIVIARFIFSDKVPKIHELGNLIIMKFPKHGQSPDYHIRYMYRELVDMGVTRAAFTIAFFLILGTEPNIWIGFFHYPILCLILI